MYVTTPAPSISAHPNLSSGPFVPSPIVSQTNSLPNCKSAVPIEVDKTWLIVLAVPVEYAVTFLQVFDESIVIVPAASDLTVVAFAPIILCASLTEPFSTKFK